MRAYSNSDTVGVHVTSSCNRRCGHCYQRNFTRDMNIDAVCRTLEGMEFANILLYGGEPLVRPFTVRSFMARWPGRGFYLAANGTVPDWEIYDRVDGILLTLESFLPQRQPRFRDFGRGAFRTIMTVLDRYAEKIRILHNVYPYGNDPAFYRMARLRGLDVAVYPVIIPGTEWDMYEESFHSLRVFEPLVRPKRRVLEDGTATRDMRGIYNGDNDLPVHDKCRTCGLLTACPFVSMFPHFCHDVIRDMRGVEPWFCDCVKTFAEKGVSGGRENFLEKVSPSPEPPSSSKTFIEGKHKDKRRNATTMGVQGALRPAGGPGASSPRKEPDHV